MFASGSDRAEASGAGQQSAGNRRVMQLLAHRAVASASSGLAESSSPQTEDTFRLTRGINPGIT